MKHHHIFVAITLAVIGHVVAGKNLKRAKTFLKYPHEIDEEEHSNAINEGMGGQKGSTIAYSNESTDGFQQAQSHGIEDKHIESQSEGDEDVESPESQPEGGVGSQVEKMEQLQADEEAQNPSQSEMGEEYRATTEQEEASQEPFAAPPHETGVGVENTGEGEPAIEEKSQDGQITIRNNNCGCMLESSKENNGKQKKTTLIVASSDLEEFKDAINELYGRAKRINLVSSRPEIESINDVKSALDALESTLNNDSNLSTPHESERISEEASEGSSSSNEALENSMETNSQEQFRQIPSRKRILSTKKHFKQHRFVQQEDDDVEENEDEEAEREGTLDDAEENYTTKKELDEGEVSAESPPKLSPSEIKQKLLEHGQNLEKIIGSILSSNSGIPDLLGTNIRQQYLKAIAPSVSDNAVEKAVAPVEPQEEEEEEETNEEE